MTKINLRLSNIEDFDLIQVQEFQKAEFKVMSNALKQMKNWWTLYNSETNEPMMMFCFIEANKSRCCLYALVSKNISKHIVGCFKFINKLIKVFSHAYKRLECTVKTDFKQGHRCVKMLGFNKEVDMPYYENDETYTLYSIIGG